MRDIGSFCQYDRRYVITKLYHWWNETRSSFWFAPAVIVLGALGLASLLIAIDTRIDRGLWVLPRWPLVFGAGAAGARGLLSTVATSMITVAGVVFSITIVALSLTSSQYTSRVLRNFMRHRVNQVVLGVFVGIFAYCLVVLRTIRGGDEGAFVPSLAVLGALVLAFVGIGFLIYFIHHIALSIQASSILAAVADETIAVVDRLFPQELGDDLDEGALDRVSLPADDAWLAVAAARTGYLEVVDAEALLTVARERDAVVRMERGIGEFVVAGTTLASIGPRVPIDEATTRALNAAYVISRQRTVQQDAAFGIRQIVDIALRALSPGINDSTTAVMCVDYLEAILVRIAERRVASPFRMQDGSLRVIARGHTFETLLAAALDQIRQSATGNITVLTRMLQALALVASRTQSRPRQGAIREHADLVAAVARRAATSPRDEAAIAEALAAVSARLARRAAPAVGS